MQLYFCKMVCKLHEVNIMFVNPDKKIEKTEIIIGLAAMIPFLFFRAWVITHIWNTSTTVNLGEANVSLVAALTIIYGILTAKTSPDSGKSGYIYSNMVSHFFGGVMVLCIVSIMHLIGLLTP